ncbi:hypothetical protein J2W49_001582 [Hydrogenophaga palleronii]|uniref:Uncharacterized protein n=1 Tax=Hydrogenophaga palleronii TaxID=65655 RepID=A0ABU1WL26_9BURK|nr:hypothetical protein [Hydrogenophaga palleronii]
MNTEILDHEEAHLMGKGATDPIEPSGSALAALLLLAGNGPAAGPPPRQTQPPRGAATRAAAERGGKSPPLRRRALPAHPLTAHSGPSNCSF